MKKIYLAVMFLAFAFGAQSQISSNYPILNFDPDNLYFDYGEIVISNNSSTDYTVKLRQEIVDAPDGASMAICFGVTCYPPNSTDGYVYPGEFEIPANGMDENFKVTYNNNSSDANASWKLVLFDEATGNDLYTFDVFYDGPLGITEIYMSESEVSLPTPNPVENEAVISYELPNGVHTGEINIHNITGSLVQQIELNQNEGDIRIYASELEKGVYFYSLMVNGVALHTKRMVIAQ